jgi:hypothetical protein
MKVVEMLKDRLYFSLAVIFAFLMGILYPYIQSFGNIGFWFQNIAFPNFVLYLIFSILFGIFVSFHIHNIREHKVCNVKSLSSGLSGSVLGFLVGQCLVCGSFVPFFIPLSGVILLTLYAPIFIIVSILLLVLSIYLSHGFDR